MLYKRRILIIDASSSARSILFKELQNRLTDIDIIACGTAREALSACRRYEFEIITTGLSLPDGDGYAMIDDIREHGKNQHTPIFVVSGDTPTRIDDVDDYTHAITAYFDKSEGHKALVDFICDFLRPDATFNARILYVDPSATSAAITRSILEKNRFNFDYFKSPQAALDLLRKDFDARGRCSWDVLLTDSTLDQEMTGYDLIQAVRNDIGLDYLELPVLLMTVEPGENEKTDFTGIFGAGSNDFITKPLTDERLTERLINLVNIKRQHEALQG